MCFDMWCRVTRDFISQLFSVFSNTFCLWIPLLHVLYKSAMFVNVQYRFEVLPRIPCSTEMLSSFITSPSQFEVCRLCHFYRADDIDWIIDVDFYSLLSASPSVNKVNQSWFQFLAVSLQVTWVINPTVDCHYFPPGPQLPSQPLRGLLLVSLLGEQRHGGCEQFA